MRTVKQIKLYNLINKLAEDAHRNALNKGWYDQDRNPPELICLIHSELSEALEAFRNHNPPDEHCPEYSSAEIELADAIIRILDMCAYLGFDISGAILAKMTYNLKRPQRHNGKAY